MALEDIIQKILEDARAEASAIRLEGEANFIKKEKEYLAELEAYRAELRAKKEAAEEIIARKQASAERRHNKAQSLASKNATIDAVLESVHASLVKLPDNEYVTILKSLFSKYNFTAGIYLVPELRADITKPLLPEGAKMTVVSSITGGFIYKGQECEIDNSFKNLLFKEWKEELVLEISQLMTHK